MGRRWIAVEMEDHCHTHIIPRLKKVIDGQDSGGITGSVGWKGGGGFRYYRLAPSLPQQGSLGQLGHQRSLQSCHARRGGVQVNGL
jgi:adenine-specific DNA-methyltransferase